MPDSIAMEISVRGTLRLAVISRISSSGSQAIAIVLRPTLSSVRISISGSRRVTLQISADVVITTLCESGVIV